MAILRNEFSWSKSRHESLVECARKYFYQYYGSWGGWDAGAPEIIRRLYLLKQMKNLDLATGTAVHTTIEETLRQLQSGVAPDPVAARSRVRDLLNQAWAESRRQRWRDDPKRFANLFEHYYRQSPTPGRIDQIRAKALGCIDRFFQLPWFDFIRGSEPSAFVSIEELDSFEVDGVKVFVKLDFALRRNGLYYLFDWKTGKAGERDPLQLACYANFGAHRWGASPEAIRIVIAYLGDGMAEERTITAAEMDQALRFIADSAATMRARLVNPMDNVARIEDFPQVDDRRLCARCVFREVCRPDELG